MPSLIMECDRRFKYSIGMPLVLNDKGTKVKPAEGRVPIAVYHPVKLAPGIENRGFVEVTL